MSKSPQVEKIALSISDVVAATTLCRSLVYQEITAKRLKTFKIGARTLIAQDDLQAWINSYRIGVAL